MPTAVPESDTATCKICGAKTSLSGRKAGQRINRIFELRQCFACGFSFITNPWTDFAQIYDEAYYRGLGSDPLVDYLFELERPAETIRQFEWAGIVRAIGSLVPLTSKTRWLDFGCGNGGLVRHCRESVGCDALGFEQGWISERARAQGIPILDAAALDRERNSFDVVTAVEVIEHVIEPLDLLRRIRALLKPGGLFFLTTGNAEPFRRDLTAWSYVLPEIHVSFFEPRTLAQALAQTGFRPEFHGFRAGHEDIIKFKVLKNLGCSRRRFWWNLLPWKLLARLCDARWKITAHPSGWAR